MSESKLIARTKVITHNCPAILEDDRSSMSTPEGGAIYEFFNNESVLSMQMNVILLDGKLITVYFSATRMSGDKVDLPDPVKKHAMQFLLGYLSDEKINTSRYLVMSANLNFKINDNAVLAYQVELTVPKGMEEIKRGSISVFDPGKGEDF
jgi:hypothetical protein